MPCPFHDAFKAPRQHSSVLVNLFGHEEIPLLLKHADVRAAARDWETFSSDRPFRVPIPSEEHLRSVRQLPIETDPPVHQAYRTIVEPFFKRAKNPAVIAQVQGLVSELITTALAQNEIEIVHELALPLQSRALTYLLNMPEAAAETWIGWGMHVFHDAAGDGHTSALECYLQAELDRAAAAPGDDFFSALTQATFAGRPLRREEMLGFANLTFAGGRDTIIHSVSSIFYYMAQHPTALSFLREDAKRIVAASEEFFRVMTPLTHIGRVCPAATKVDDFEVPAEQRIALGWAAANFDETVFDDPETVRLDRKPNPHVAFGFGPHLCLGAPHARLLIRTLLDQMSQRLARVEVRSADQNIETEPTYERANGFTSLRVKLTGPPA
jgi:cytochrome P450